MERGDFWSLVRRFSRSYWRVVAACVLLAVVFFALYNGRNAYGALGLICSLLAVLFAMSPFFVAANEMMDVYYFDRQWAASYRPHRRTSVDLTRVTRVSTSSGLWTFQRGARWGVVVPEGLILLEPVLAVVSRAVSQAARTPPVKMSERTRGILRDAAVGAENDDALFDEAIAKPPYKAWNDVRRRPRSRNRDR